MIPVLGVPILNRPDLLSAMLASVDVPVDRLVIVDNGGVVSGISGTVICPGANLGVAASWNLIIQANPSARWWLLANSDIVFAPGDLARLADHMDARGGIAVLRDMAAFGISADVVQRVGHFDANFIPAYCEDVDYAYRCQLAGVEIAWLPAEYTHLTSSTIGSDPHLGQENARTYPANRDYYAEKWGGPMGSEAFRTPFNRGGHVGDWRLDHERLARLSWR